MSEDIDFIEIDKLMAEMEEDSRVKKEIATDVEKVASKARQSHGEKLSANIMDVRRPQKQPKKAEHIVVTSKKDEVKHASQQPHGKFMDMVHPMSDMTMKVRPDRKAAPISVNQEGIKVGVSQEQEKPSRRAITSVEEVKNMREVSSFVPASKQASSVDELDDLMNEIDGYGEIEAPFLENVQVEKRPLGGGEPIRKSIKSNRLAIDDVVDDITDFDKSFLDDGDEIDQGEGENSRLSRSSRSTDNEKSDKNFSIIDFILKTILVLSIIVLGIVIGWIAYVSGIFEGIF